MYFHKCCYNNNSMYTSVPAPYFILVGLQKIFFYLNNKNNFNLVFACLLVLQQV